MSPISLLALGSAALMLLVSACGHPAERRLEGRWRGESVQKFAIEELAAATGWARATTFDFRKKNLTVAIPAEDPRSGTFEIASFRDGRVALAVTRADGTQDRLDLILDDERSMRWVLDRERTITMQRLD